MGCTWSTSSGDSTSSLFCLIGARSSFSLHDCTSYHLMAFNFTPSFHISCPSYYIIVYAFLTCSSSLRSCTHKRMLLKHILFYQNLMFSSLYFRNQNTQHFCLGSDHACNCCLTVCAVRHTMSKRRLHTAPLFKSFHITYVADSRSLTPLTAGRCIHFSAT